MKKLVSSLVSTILMLVFILSGCGLQNPSSVKRGIEDLLPGCEILGVEESQRCNTYTVKYNDIEFKVYNKYNKYIDSIAEHTEFTTDYFIKVLETDKVKSILEKHGMTVSRIYRESSPVLEPYAQNSDELRKIYDFIDEFNECVYEYLPEEKFFNAEFQIEPKYDSADSKYDSLITQEEISVRGEIDWDYEYYCTLIDMKAETKNYSTDDEIKYTYPPEYFTNVDYESIPQRYIYNLYIDGNEFTSEKYDVKFFYRIEDDSYYTVTGYGQQFENNLGVEDHIHREIITYYYPDSNYTIKPISQITTYQINGNNYKMTSTLEPNKTEFYKNNKPLDIVTIRDIDGHSPKGNYFVFINVEDWADLMEMNVDRIDESGVYLSVK